MGFCEQLSADPMFAGGFFFQRVDASVGQG
jgi:hypothetical protein